MLYLLLFRKLNITMLTAIRFRNFFILLATFCVLCLSPLADIHVESCPDNESYVHGQGHHETCFHLFLHELLFTYLQHTFDHVNLNLSHQTLKSDKSTSCKGIASSHPQAICNDDSQLPAVHLSTSKSTLPGNRKTAGLYSQDFSGLSPPSIFC